LFQWAGTWITQVAPSGRLPVLVVICAWAAGVKNAKRIAATAILVTMVSVSRVIEVLLWISWCEFPTSYFE